MKKVREILAFCRLTLRWLKFNKTVRNNRTASFKQSLQREGFNLRNHGEFSRERELLCSLRENIIIIIEMEVSHFKIHPSVSLHYFFLFIEIYQFKLFVTLFFLFIEIYQFKLLTICHYHCSNHALHYESTSFLSSNTEMYTLRELSNISTIALVRIIKSPFSKSRN